MSGPAPLDAVTYSASAGWVTTSLGASFGATALPMANYVATADLEPQTGNLVGFNATPSLLLGANTPTTPSYPGLAGLFMAKNKLLAANAWAKGAGTTALTVNSSNYYPVSWTPGGTITSAFFNQGQTQETVAVGNFTLQYDDAYYSGGAPSASTVTLSSPATSYASCTQVGSTTVSGTTVTKVYAVAITNPYQSAYAFLDLVLSVTASDGMWHLSNPWVFAPNNTIDRSNRYAVDDVVVASLTGPTGAGRLSSDSWIPFFPTVVSATTSIRLICKTPTPIAGKPSTRFRFCHLTRSAIRPPREPWSSITARFLNTNVSSATYAWSSPRLYSTQSWASSGTDSFGPYLDMTHGPNGVNDNGALFNVVPQLGKLGTYMVVELRSLVPHNLKTGQSLTVVHEFLSCTTTNGSATVTTASTANLVAGIALAGTGIPANATILSINSLTQFTLSANATASGTNTLDFAPIIPTTSVGNSNVFDGYNSIAAIAYVTGEYTIAFSLSIGYLSGSNSTTPQYVNSTTEIPIVLPVQLYQPANPGCIPYQFAASVVSHFPNCAYWLNLPYPGSDALYQAIAEAVVPQLGPTNGVLLEMGNEHWNNQTLATTIQLFYQALPAYTSNPVFSFTTTSGASSSFPGGSAFAAFSNGYAAHAAHAFDVFTKAAVAAGFSASRIKRTYGSWAATPGVSQTLVNMITTYGMPADYISIAPYSNNDQAPSTIPAYVPAGYPGVTNPGNWPIQMINDFYRHQIFYSKVSWTMWQGHGGYVYPAGLSLVAYECAVQSPTFSGNLDYQALAWDATQHPSYYDLQRAYYRALQQGNPTTGNPGALRELLLARRSLPDALCLEFGRQRYVVALGRHHATARAGRVRTSSSRRRAAVRARDTSRDTRIRFRPGPDRPLTRASAHRRSSTGPMSRRRSTRRPTSRSRRHRAPSGSPRAS